MHTFQIFTGLHMLGIRYKMIAKDPSSLTVRVNGSVCHFDMKDSATMNKVACDHYFKRSYANQEDAHPLGFNYPVFPKMPTWSVIKNIRSIYDLNTAFYLRWRPRMVCAPPEELEPRVLFCVKVYDPYDRPRNRSKIREMETMNQLRTASVAALRKALGARFFGGVTRDRFSETHCPDLLLPGDNGGRQYLKRMRQYPICVTTTGLHKSIGWKMGEYVAHSRAIVTEPLHFIVPGKPAYLEFTTPDECVSQCMRLIKDKDLRLNMMRANYAYYNDHLRPDILVANALSRVMPHAIAKNSRKDSRFWEKAS